MEIRRGESEIGVELTGFLPCCYYVIMNIVHERKEISLQLKSMDSSLPFDLFNNNSHLVCYRSPTGFASKILCTKTLKYWLKKNYTHNVQKNFATEKSNGIFYNFSSAFLSICGTNLYSIYNSECAKLTKKMQ